MEIRQRLRRSWGFWCIAVVAALPAPAETLVVATYNVQNYVATDRMTPDGFRPDYPKPESEKRALRAVIREIGADVLILQEMGPPPYLEELRRDLHREGLSYPYHAVLTGPDPDRHVAMLSRRRPVTLKQHSEIPFEYLGRTELVKRGLLEVTFSTVAGEFTIFGLHLKSRLTEQVEDRESDLRRAAEAMAVRSIVLRRFPLPAAGRFLLLGDCNDGKDSRTLQHLLRRGQLEVGELVPATDSRGEAWTYYYRTADSYTRVDHLIASAQLRPFIRGGTARIIDSIETRQASDHRPIVVVLDFRPPDATPPAVSGPSP